MKRLVAVAALLGFGALMGCAVEPTDSGSEESDSSSEEVGEAQEEIVACKRPLAACYDACGEFLGCTLPKNCIVTQQVCPPSE